MRMTLTLGIAIVLLVATVPAEDDARLPGAETVCVSLTVTLRDGSKLLGRPSDLDALPALLGAERVKIPLIKIVLFKMRDDRVSAVVRLENGSRLVATIPLDSIRLETSIGRLSLSLDEIASCHVSTAVVTSGNVALASRGASVGGVFDGGSGPALIDGNTTDYDGSSGFAHLVGLPASWVIKLPQTYLLGEIRLCAGRHPVDQFLYGKMGNWIRGR